MLSYIAELPVILFFGCAEILSCRGVVIRIRWPSMVRHVNIHTIAKLFALYTLLFIIFFFLRRVCHQIQMVATGKIVA